MKSKNLVIITVIILFSMVGGTYLVFSATKQPVVNVASYNSSDKKVPKVEAKKTKIDLGKIKVSEKKTVEFTIKNTGTKPLQLFDISSSCGCTAAQIIYQDVISKEFSMHSVGTFNKAILPNTKAKLKVIYRPYTMPVYGAVGREVFLSTNDPRNPKLAFQIKAYVE